MISEGMTRKIAIKAIRLFCAVAAAWLAGIGTAYSQTADKGKSADGELIDAVAEINAREYKQAADRLEKITAGSPEYDAAYYYLGICRLFTNDVAGAKTAFRKAAELDSTNFWYKERLARAYSMDGEDDLTVATYEELLKEFPKNNDIYFTLVNLYLKRNEYDKALDALEQIDAAFGRSENVTATKYDILLRQNKPAEALKVLEDYNKEFSSPYVLTKLGDHSMAEYKDSAAIAYYDEALELQGNYIPAVLGKAEVYRNKRQFPEFFKLTDIFVSDKETDVRTKVQYLEMLANRTDIRYVQSVKPQMDSLFDKLVMTHPSDSSALLASGLYWYSNAMNDKARTLLRRNMEAYPESRNATLTYIQLLAMLKDWDSVETACDSALVKFPSGTEFLDIKNVACYNRENWQGIIDNNRRIIEIAQGDTSLTVPAMSSIGDMYHEMGREEEAFKVYEKVLKINPEYAPALNNYAYYLALVGKKLKKACAMSRKAVEKEPDNPTYLDTYGWILHLLGKDQEAKAQFKHAILYGAKESSTCLEHYAAILEALGETDLAKVYASQAAARKAEGK